MYELQFLQIMTCRLSIGSLYTSSIWCRYSCFHLSRSHKYATYYISEQICSLNYPSNHLQYSIYGRFIKQWTFHVLILFSNTAWIHIGSDEQQWVKWNLFSNLTILYQLFRILDYVFCNTPCYSTSPLQLTKELHCALQSITMSPQLPTPKNVRSANRPALLDHTKTRPNP